MLNRIKPVSSKIKVQRSKLLLIGVLLLLAVGERLWWDLGNNVELVTLATFAAGLYLGRRSALFVPLFILALTDIFITNTPIMLFTWSAYALIGLAVIFTKRFTKTSGMRILTATIGGSLAGIWFYLWTNFGVWLLDTQGMYPKTAAGLMQSYIMGLPFLRNQFMSNLVILPLGIGSIELVYQIYRLFTKKYKIAFS